MKRIFTQRKMKFQHTHDTSHNVGHGKDAESLQVPSEPILKGQDYWPVILATNLNMFVLCLLHPVFQDAISFPALRVLPRQIFGKSSLCMWFLISVKAEARVVWKGEQQYLGQQSRRSWAAGVWLLDRELRQGWEEDRGRLAAQGEEFRDTFEKNGMIQGGRNWIFILQPYNPELGYTGSVRTSRDWSRRGWGLHVTWGSSRDGVTLGHLRPLPAQTTRHSQVCGPEQMPKTWWNTHYSQQARCYLLFFFYTGNLFSHQQM